MKINKTLSTIAILLAQELVVMAALDRQQAAIEADKDMQPDEREGDLALIGRLRKASLTRQGWWEADKVRIQQRAEKAREAQKAAGGTQTATPVTAARR